MIDTDEIANENQNESADISTKWVGLAGFAFLAFVVAMSLIVAGVYGGRLTTHLEASPDFPKPRPGAEIVAELKRLRAQEDAALAHYQKNQDGTAQVPIERAMQLVIRHDLLSSRKESVNDR